MYNFHKLIRSAGTDIMIPIIAEALFPPSFLDNAIIPAIIAPKLLHRGIPKLPTLPHLITIKTTATIDNKIDNCPQFVFLIVSITMISDKNFI